ncbi:MAG: DinB family protein [Chloroflexota bacterium]|nr:DinB family protein [Chloroflexota bacterium]
MLDNYRDLIDELLETPSELRRLVEARTEPPTAEAVQLLDELRSRDQRILGQLQAMTRAREPYLRTPSDPAPAPVADVPALLNEFDTARGELVSLLMNLTLRDWERTAIHETEGEVRLVELVETHVDFDEGHVRKLRQGLA